MHTLETVAKARRTIQICVLVLGLVGLTRIAGQPLDWFNSLRGGIPAEVADPPAGIKMPKAFVGITPLMLQFPGIGGRGFDSSLIYPGQSYIGRAIHESGLPRSAFFVITKVPCCLTRSTLSVRYDWDSMCLDEIKLRPQLGGLRSAWNGTALAHEAIANLNVSGYVDLLLVHWPCAELSASLAHYASLEPLVASGHARALGVSNFNSTQLLALDAVARVKPIANQIMWSVGQAAGGIEFPEVGSDRLTLRTMARLRIAPIAYSPLLDRNYTTWTGDHVEVHSRTHPLVERLALLHGVHAAAIGLRFLVQEGFSFVGATFKLPHLQSMLDAEDDQKLLLSDAEMRELGSYRL